MFLEFLQGIVIGKSTEPYACALLVNGGWGLSILVSRRTWELLSPEREQRLFVHLSINGEDSRLYGFLEAAERQLFQLLCTVRGVSGKIAINILDHIGVEELLAAVQSNQPRFLREIPGIGPKLAERTIFELKERSEALAELVNTLLASSHLEEPAQHTLQRVQLLQDTRSTLTALGYLPEEAERAIQRQLSTEGSAELSTAAFLESCLRWLSQEGDSRSPAEG